MASNCLATINGVTLAFNIPIARSCFICATFVTVSKQCVILNCKVFEMFFDVLDVRLEISVVSTHVHLNGLGVYVKNRKTENRSVRWF